MACHDENMNRRSVVAIYVRHGGDCAFEGKPFYRGCQCPKWLRWSFAGKQYRKAADTRAWGIAEERRAEQQAALDDPSANRTADSRPDTGTLAAAIETFIKGKEGRNFTAPTIGKLTYQLGVFEAFMSAHSKFFPADITVADLIEYRSTWNTWKSGVTQRKAQTNLRALIRFCCKNYAELLPALGTIKLTKEDRRRLEPKPFTEAELTRLIHQVPKTFPDATKAARMTALIHCMVSTGLAIRDTIQLERDSLRDGWLRINRQKTDKLVKQRLDPALHAELLAVTNGNPKYVFWNGSSLPNSAVGIWQHDLRALMEDAGLWIKGNLSHRFRDTAVDFWLGAGCSLTEIAAMLGDTVSVLEEHYLSLISKRMEERLAKVPVRTW